MISLAEAFTEQKAAPTREPLSPLQQAISDCSLAEAGYIAMLAIAMHAGFQFHFEPVALSPTGRACREARLGGRVQEGRAKPKGTPQTDNRPTPQSDFHLDDYTDECRERRLRPLQEGWTKESLQWFASDSSYDNLQTRGAPATEIRAVDEV